MVSLVTQMLAASNGIRERESGLPAHTPEFMFSQVQGKNDTPGQRRGRISLWSLPFHRNEGDTPFSQSIPPI